MRRVAALLTVALLSVACSDQEPADEAGPATVVAPTASPASEVQVTAPDVSSVVTVQGEEVRSTSEVRVAEILSDLQTAAAAEGTVITLPELVLFDFGEDQLKPEAEQTIAEMAEVIGFYAGAPVEVRGHTDAVGADDVNLALSERRAAAVVDALVGKGVDRARLEPQGLGETQPVAPNAQPDGSDDPAGRERNRRVEIVLRGVTR